MWTRKEMKAKGKETMHRSYWKTVLVSFILVVLLGGGGAAIGGRAGAGAALDGGSAAHVQEEQQIEDAESNEIADDIINGITDELPPDVSKQDVEEMHSGIQSILQALKGMNLVLVIGAAILFALVIAAVAVVVQALLLNPLEAGGARFFLRNLNSPAEVKELAFCYDHGYLNVVKTIFFRDLYTILWCLLFIIPGIVKGYEYRMMPYILAEDPDMPTKEVFAMSREMMRGQKWKAFVLDLSFLGWGILSLLTLGIVGIFYVNPYRNMTNAALYERLRYGEEQKLIEAEA